MTGKHWMVPALLLALAVPAWAEPGMGTMQGGDPPADARDPHAYSGGYTRPADHPLRLHDEKIFWGVMLDRLETAQGRDNGFNAYDFRGFIGRDYDRLVIKAEGEVDGGRLQEGRTELLWSHAVAAYWDTQLGLRHDSGVGPDRTWLAVGVQGLAPYWFHVDATAYAGEGGRTALRLGAEYEMLLTQRLILSPRIEANFYGKRDPALERGAGLADGVFGLRLRYEIRREFAPYIGVEWAGKFGQTADMARDEGLRTRDTRFVAGVRVWF
ncbi:copper resistance protein B [Thiobacter aerophilum]|uniref:Copper resistance protein B n=1 Tax=Thiobacter aerophilum TaxID=3121275 RepID=A0ABV0EBW8_9BURK